MPAKPETSLDRFLKNRAAHALVWSNRSAMQIQIGIGILLSAIGVGMACSPAFGADPQVAFGAAGPLLAGAVNAGVGFTMRKRFANQSNAQWKLTPEAKALLYKLVRDRLGWWGIGANPGAHGFAGIHARRAMRRGIWYSTTSRDTLEPQAEELLEEAAEQFNRILGTFEAADSSAGLKRMAPNALAASDEVMAEILHHAAMLDKYPESGETSESLILEKIQSLRELADGAQELATKSGSIIERATRNSTMDGVLDELRLEKMARAELRTEPIDNQDQRA